MNDKWNNWTLGRRLQHGRISRALCLEAADRIKEVEEQLGYVDNHRRELQSMLHEHGICADCGKKYEHCDLHEEH